jgi:endonuclease/exonuclease/phosphatase family metal-dependent hydrolase
MRIMGSLHCKYLSVLFLLIFPLINITIASDSLKIMSYNIQGMKPGTDPDTRLTYIIEKLKELDPDILGIQEINETLTDTSTNQAKIIADSLSAHFGIEYYCHYSFTHLSWSNAFREFVGIISKHPIIESGYKQLPPGLFIRKVVWSYIDSPLGMINFFSTHLSFTNVEARINQVEEIIPYVAETEPNNPGIASVLVGDFNDVPNSEPIVMLTGMSGGDYFIDTFLKIHPYGNPGYTVDSDNLERRIDYIFYKNTGSLIIENSYVVMEEPYLGNLYCSDHLGVMTIVKPAPTSIFESENNLDEYKLYQNYPNPFNPATTIKYNIPVNSEQHAVGSYKQNLSRAFGGKNSQSTNHSILPAETLVKVGNQSNYRFASLKIFDILGCEVATLVNEYQRPGQYEVSWDASALSSGIYFYTLSAGQITITKKLVVIK